MYVCLDEQEAYDPIVLEKSYIQKKCKKYFDEHPDDFSAAGFCNELTFVSPKKYKIPLSYGTKLRAMKCFYTILSEREDLDLDKRTVGKLALHTTDTMPVDHDGQEMSLGDDIGEDSEEEDATTVEKSVTSV
jgi:hypothetical protein